MATEKRQNIPDFRLFGPREKVAGYTLSAAAASAAQLLDITGSVRPRLVSLTLTEKRGGEADQLDLVLNDADGKLAIPRIGAVLRLQLGWKQGADVTPGLIDKGRFKVDEVEWSGAPDQVTIRARSTDMTERMKARREKSWKDTTLGAIVREIAGANSLTPRIDAALAAITIPVLVQHNQSDLALLKRLGREHDAVATVKDGNLIFSPIGKGQTSAGLALPGFTLTRFMGSGYRFSTKDRGAAGGVEARWHDQASGTRKTVTVGGGKGKPQRVRRVHHSEASARRAAAAARNRTSRAAAEFSMTIAFGRADLYPERPVILSGFKAEADALKWIVAEVAHNLSKSGYTLSLKLETKG